MKFNTLIIDKLNNFDSVSNQNSKKSSLVQFSDIINVYNSKWPNSIKDSSMDTSRAADKILTNPENIIQVSPQGLKDILSLLSVFENVSSVRPTEINEALSDTEQSKKELVLSKSQLQVFYNFVFAQFNNQPDKFIQIENIDQAKTPVTLTFDDGTNKLSITISTLPTGNIEEETPKGITDISRFLVADTISSVPLNTAVPVQSFSDDGNLSSVTAAPVQSFLDSGNSNIVSAASENNKALLVEGSVELNNNGQTNASFKAEVSQQTNTAEYVTKTPSLPVELDTVGIFESSQPKIFVKEASVLISGEKYLVDKNGLDLLTAINASKAAADSNVSGVAQQQKAIPIEQILFGNKSATDISAKSVLPKDVLQSLSNEDRSILLKSFSYSDLLSIEYSQEAAKPFEAAPKIENASPMLSNEVFEGSKVSVDQQISKQALIFNLLDEQFPSGDKSVPESLLQLRDLTTSVVLVKEQNEKILDGISPEPNSQVNNPAAFDKESVVKVFAKEEKQTSKNSDSTKLNNLDDAKTDKQPLRDAQSNQQEGKDTAKHSSNDPFKNSVLLNFTGAGDEKAQSVSELKTFPNVIKTITTNEIIPEFSKVIQQDGKQTITFQLSPENLGKVKLTVDMVANNLNARIEVENEQVKQFLQSNIDQLKQNFQSNRIQLNNINISLADYNQRDAKAFVPKKKFSNRYLKDGMVEKASSPASKKLMGYNTYEFLA